MYITMYVIQSSIKFMKSTRLVEPVQSWPFGAETRLFRKNKVNTKCAARPSAAMSLIMCDQQVLVFQVKGFQWPALYQFWKVIED